MDFTMLQKIEKKWLLSSRNCPHCSQGVPGITAEPHSLERGQMLYHSQPTDKTGAVSRNKLPYFLLSFNTISVNIIVVLIKRNHKGQQIHNGVDLSTVAKKDKATNQVTVLFNRESLNNGQVNLYCLLQETLLCSLVHFDESPHPNRIILHQ